MNSSKLHCYVKCSLEASEKVCYENVVPELTSLDSMPTPDWEYYCAWMQCIKIRYLVSELQEKCDREC